MSRRDDGIVDIDLPFFHVYVGGRGGRGLPVGDEEEVIEMEMGDTDEYRAVRRRVRARLRFFRHAFIFAAVNSVLFLIDWSTGGGYWVQWVALIWGIFVGWEFVSNFVGPYLWGREMEERLIQRELRRRRGG